MRVLIGTPIHISKDYSMDRWIENVSRLKYPADLLMVDNSPDSSYLEVVRGYCKKHGVDNYKLVHIEVNQECGIDERVARAREVVRQEVLSKGYDAWFTWECDQLIPNTALDDLIRLMEYGDFMMVHPNSWAREIPSQTNTDFGCSLVKRECLEKYGFLLEYGKVNDPDMMDCWHGGESWFKKRVLMGGGNYIEVYGVINPIYHLNT